MDKCRNSFINVDIIGFLASFTVSPCILPTINHGSKLIYIFVAFMNVRQLHLLGVAGGARVSGLEIAGKRYAKLIYKSRTTDLRFQCTLHPFSHSFYRWRTHQAARQFGEPAKSRQFSITAPSLEYK